MVPNRNIASGDTAAILSFSPSFSSTIYPWSYPIIPWMQNRRKIALENEECSQSEDSYPLFYRLSGRTERGMTEWSEPDIFPHSRDPWNAGLVGVNRCDLPMWIRTVSYERVCSFLGQENIGFPNQPPYLYDPGSYKILLHSLIHFETAITVSGNDPLLCKF